MPTRASPTDLVLAALRALRQYSPTLLFIEHFGYNARSPTGTYSSHAGLQAIFLEISMLLETARLRNVTVIIAAPVYSAAWQHKQTTITLSDVTWKKGVPRLLLNQAPPKPVIFGLGILAMTPF